MSRTSTEAKIAVGPHMLPQGSAKWRSDRLVPCSAFRRHPRHWQARRSERREAHRRPTESPANAPGSRQRGWRPRVSRSASACWNISALPNAHISALDPSGHSTDITHIRRSRAPRSRSCSRWRGLGGGAVTACVGRGLPSVHHVTPRRSIGVRFARFGCGCSADGYRCRGSPGRPDHWAPTSGRVWVRGPPS